MTTVSPLSALSTSLLRQARASLIFIVRIFTSIVYVEKVHYLPRTVNRIPIKGDVIGDVAVYVVLRFSPPGGGVWGQRSEPQNCRGQSHRGQ
jgi:hypothetical protein